MDLDVLFPVGVFLLVAVIIVVGLLFEHKRNKRLEELAGQLRMSYTKKPDPQVLHHHAGFHLFNQGHSRNAANLMERSLSGTDTAYFEYRYTTGHGKNSSVHRQSIISVSNPGVSFPQFVLGPENFLHRIYQKFAGTDINFENYPEFSRQFQLKGLGEAGIRELFADEVIRFLEGSKGLNIESSGNRIIFYKKRSRCSVKQIEQFIRDSLECYTLLARANQHP